jgi:hypothetical protein
MQFPHDYKQGNRTGFSTYHHGSYDTIEKEIPTWEFIFGESKSSQGTEEQSSYRTDYRGKHTIEQVVPYRNQIKQPFKIFQSRVADYQGIEARDFFTHSLNGNNAHPKDWKQANYDYQGHKAINQNCTYIFLGFHHC